MHWIVCQGVTSFCVKIEDSQSRLNLWLHKAKTWNILRKLVLFWGIYEKSFSLKYINRKGTWDFTASCVDKIIMGETSERVLIPLQLDELVLFSLNMLIVLHPMAFLHPLTQQRGDMISGRKKVLSTFWIKPHLLPAGSTPPLFLSGQLFSMLQTWSQMIRHVLCTVHAYLLVLVNMNCASVDRFECCHAINRHWPSMVSGKTSFTWLQSLIIVAGLSCPVPVAQCLISLSLSDNQVLIGLYIFIVQTHYIIYTLFYFIKENQHLW